MRLDNFLYVCNENFHDVDCYTDYTDDLEICYCGADDFGLTEEGLKEFGEIMELDVDWEEGNACAVIKINDCPNAEELNHKLCMFFKACAGYVSESLYEKWFKIAE